MRTLVLLALSLGARCLLAQSTRAERTAYRETSSYADVVGFLDSLRHRGAGIRLDTLGVSPEGKPIPLVIASRPLVADPEAARRSMKPVIYVQGNIHAGEVEGKEAALALLRELTLGSLAPLLDSVVLLMVPIYNVDGNERLARGEENRPGQNGPAMVGRRANGAGLDLNRDYVKMEAPETRAAAALLRAWDPDIFVDLHTTNGSYHGYLLTYAPGLNPNETPAATYARDHFLPALRERMAGRHAQRTFSYGNFRNQDPDSLAQGWETYDPRPRFGTNWVGMRGRLSVLSEAYSNADFGSRVSVTYNFVRELLSLAAEERVTIHNVTRDSDRLRGDSVTVRSTLGAPVWQDVIAELTDESGEGTGMYARRRRTGVFRTIRMPVYDRFTPARREARPAAYLLPPVLEPVTLLLRRQGVQVKRLTAGWRGAVERFTIDSVVAGEEFEGHRPTKLEGRWRTGSTGDAGPGWFLVSTDQPLGLLAAYLLEPASEDGVTTWNFLEGRLVAWHEHPILRSRQRVRVDAEDFDASSR
ncbi:MAG: M14 family metallopeptidase [Gemmatimonadales bacterium]